MSTDRLYRIATWALLALNVLLIAYVGLFRHGPPPPPDDGSRFRSRAVKLLDLDEEQNELFKARADAHHEKIMELDRSQTDLIQRYFGGLATQTAIDSSLQDELNRVQQAKLTETYGHFYQVKELLRPEQQANFEPFLKAALRRLLPESRPGKRPGRREKSN